MKKVFTLLVAAMSAATVMADNYTDQLNIRINGMEVASQEATISIDRQDNGLYTLQLANFMLGSEMPVGNIKLTDVPASPKGDATLLAVTQQVSIEAGSLPGVGESDYLGPMLGIIPIQLRAEFTSSQLYAFISIDLTSSLGQNILCTFGDGGYQLKNSGFEDFHTASMGSATSDEPNAWHSFMSSTGLFAQTVGTVPHTFISTDTRPGSTGSKSVLVKSGKVLGFVIANGTITTGQLQADAMSATDPKNCSFTDLQNKETDGNGDPFYTTFNGYPDSLAVWVKFKQEEVLPSYPYATVCAVITDGTRYQDPEDQSYTNYLAKAQHASIESNGFVWQRLSIPFVYEEDKNGTAVPDAPKAIHITVSTNAAAGQGTESDSLLVDDIEMVYNCGLAQLSVKETPIVLEEGVYNYTVDFDGEVSVDDVHAVSSARLNSIIKSLRAEEDAAVATIELISNDLQTSKTYNIRLRGASVTGIRNIAADGEQLNDGGELYRISGQRLNNAQQGLVIERNGKGVRKMILTK